MKAKAEELHRKIQNIAKESQGKHENIVVASKEVDELRAKEDEAFKKFVELKQKFNEINNILKERLQKVGQMMSKIGDIEKKSEASRKKKTGLRRFTGCTAPNAGWNSTRFSSRG